MLDDIDMEDISKRLLETDDMTTDQLPKDKPKEASPVNKTDLATYYRNLFPYHTFYKWLGKNSTEYFERREFSFTLEGDRYVRFQCFKTNNELRNTIIHGQPIKIDIGAVYNTFPKLHKQIDLDRQFTPLEKELVFDIDMTDYDDIRTCCQKTKICDKCWKYMVAAYKILKEVLYEDFAFEKIMWVFSGRRGIHCWISDDIARKLTNEGRSAIANFIKYSIGNLNSGITAGLREPLHPSIERSIEIIESVFDEYILLGQDILNSEKGKELLKGLIKAYFNQKKDIDTFILTTIRNVLDGGLNSMNKMKTIEDQLIKYESENKGKRQSKYTITQLILKDFKLNVLYPRLDINVSKHLNHLLKSPFCIHPGTGLVSVPMSEKDIVEFSMEKIPSLEKIVKDFNANITNAQYQHFLAIFEEYANRCTN